MHSANVIKACVHLAKNSDNEERATISPIITESGFSSLGFDDGAPSSAISYTPDLHTVSNEEALSYYAGLPSEPRLLYRTGKEWSPPRGAEAQRRRKELCEVFNHQVANLWNDGLCWEVAKVMDAQRVLFTTMDVIRFKTVEVDEAPSDDEDIDEEAVEAGTKKPVISPVTIWIGVIPETTSATAAHNAAQAVLALLKDHQIIDVDIHFRESYYTRKAGPHLLKPVGDLDPLVDVISSLSPALGLHISTRNRPKAEGTMALYLAKGGNSNTLLGLTCRHVLFGSKEANIGYISHPGMSPRKVLLLGKRAYINLVDSIKLRIGRHDIAIEHWREQIEEFEEREKGTDPDDIGNARKDRVETQVLLDDAEAAMKVLGTLLGQVKNNWSKPESRVLGRVLRSPAIGLGVSEQRFMEDWGIFQVDRPKLGDGFQGNKIDLGTKLTADEFTVKCFARGDANWRFKYPRDRLLALWGTMTDELMHKPDMWDPNLEPCLLVIKSDNATNTTLSHANGVFSLVREYWYLDMSVKETSMAWGIVSYDSKSEVFSEPGDSGSIIADIRGRIGGMLTGGSGRTNSFDMTYATPFWWLLERIQANGFPNAHLNVVQ